MDGWGWRGGRLFLTSHPAQDSTAFKILNNGGGDIVGLASCQHEAGGREQDLDCFRIVVTIQGRVQGNQ